jgi:Kef-type K+ transport system membrane component KefB
MRKWLMLLLVLALASGISTAISGRLTLTGVLAQAIMFGGIFGPMYLFPERYADWGARCRLSGFRRRG